MDLLRCTSTYWKSLTSVAALPPEESKDYVRVKAAILMRYGVSEETYRRRFRAATRKGGETNRELAIRLMDLQNKWLKCAGNQGVDRNGTVPEHSTTGEEGMGQRKETYDLCPSWGTS